MAEEFVKKLADDWYFNIGKRIMEKALGAMNADNDLFTRFNRTSSYKVKRFTYATNVKQVWKSESFPTIWMTQLDPIEVGNDLTGDHINAVRVTVEVRVYDNVSYQRCLILLSPIIKTFKQYGFSVTQFPRFSNEGTNVVVGTIRCSRVVGEGDVDLTHNIVKVDTSKQDADQ